MNTIAVSRGNSSLGRALAAALILFCVALPSAFAAEPGSITPEVTQISPSRMKMNRSYKPFSRLAIGVNVGTLGPAIELATPITRKTNLRVDGSFFQYALGLSTSGVNYNGNLNLRSGRVSFDFFPWAKGFHISGGAMVYNRFNINANGLVPGGNTVTLNSTDYYSDASDPLNGAASFFYGNKVAPTLTIGWGNAIPRSGHHLSFPFEIGVAYRGVPTFNMTMAGSACENAADAADNGPTCAPAMSSSNDFSTNLTQQIHKIQNDLTPARFYPILNTGVTYRF